MREVDFTEPPHTRPYFHISSEKWDGDHQRNALLHYIHERGLDEDCLKWVYKHAPEGWIRDTYEPPEPPETDKVEGKTPFEALDHVKALREGYDACNGSLYKNVAVDLVQSFLEKCIAKWGQRFMECVERELHEARFGVEDAARFLGDKGRRELVFPTGDDE